MCTFTCKKNVEKGLLYRVVSIAIRMSLPQQMSLPRHKFMFQLFYGKFVVEMAVSIYWEI